jgi:hypothetical protein
LNDSRQSARKYRQEEKENLKYREYKKVRGKKMTYEVRRYHRKY